MWGKNLPPGAVRSAPGDGIFYSVHARSESSRLTVGSCYRMSDNASWEEALAWASIAVPDCWSTCALANLALSAAKSASDILERAAVVNSETFIRLDTVYSKRFWSAPYPARSPATCSIPPVIAASAPDGSLTRSILRVDETASILKISLSSVSSSFVELSL